MADPKTKGGARQGQSMNLTVYLLRRKYSVLAAVPIPDGYTELTGVAPAKMPVRLFLKQNTASTPPWVRWLSDLGINLSGMIPKNQSSAGILLVGTRLSATQTRIFAVTFGHGWSSITADLFQSRYGLECASRLVDPERIVHMRSLRPETNPLEVSAFRSASGKPEEFGLDLGVDIFSSLAGRPPSASSISSSFVAGTDCLRIRAWKGKLTELRKALRETLRILRTPLPPELKFLNDIRRVRDSKLRQKLTRKLHRQLRKQAGTTNVRRVVFSLPLDAELTATSYALVVGTAELPLTEPSLRALEKVIRANSLTTKNLIQSKFSYDDGNGQTRGDRLVRFLDGEVVLNGKTYLSLRGHWLEPGTTYIQGLNDRIAAIHPWSEPMPAWSVRRDEDAYNKELAASGNWLLQDKKLYTLGTSKIEPCDVLTDSWEFLHVKAGQSSAVWNHLFSQALVSARLMRNSEPFRSEIQARYDKQWPSAAPAPRAFTVVLLMASKKKGRLNLTKLPLFSKIALVEAQRSLRALEIDVFLSVVPRT